MIKTIVIVALIILVLSLLGINLRDIVNNSFVQNNFGFVWNWLKHIWSSYLSQPAVYVWEKVFIPYVWEPFVRVMDMFKKGQGSNYFDEISPKLP